MSFNSACEILTTCPRFVCRKPSSARVSVRLFRNLNHFLMLLRSIGWPEKSGCFHRDSVLRQSDWNLLQVWARVMRSTLERFSKICSITSSDKSRNRIDWFFRSSAGSPPPILLFFEGGSAILLSTNVKVKALSLSPECLDLVVCWWNLVALGQLARQPGRCSVQSLYIHCTMHGSSVYILVDRIYYTI